MAEERMSDKGREIAVTTRHDEDPAFAHRLFRLFAERHGDPEAQFHVGETYLRGQGVPEDPFEAVRWYRKSAEQGYADAQVTLGDFYYSQRFLDEDRRDESVWALLLRLLTGSSKPKRRFDLAAYWYKKAAEGGNPQAQYSLAVLHALGHGLPKCYPEALRWWHEAAVRGHAVSQEIIGTDYFYGESLVQDFVSAYLWLSLAASQGETRATTFLDEHVLPMMSAREITEAERLVHEWQPKQSPEIGSPPNIPTTEQILEARERLDILSQRV